MAGYGLEALRRSREGFERPYRYRARGYDYHWLVGQVAALFEVPEYAPLLG
jgi:hypothetical protein